MLRHQTQKRAPTETPFLSYQLAYWPTEKPGQIAWPPSSVAKNKTTTKNKEIFSLAWTK